MLTSIIAFVCAVFLTIKITLAEWFGLNKPKPSLKRWQVTRIYLFCEPNDTPLDDDAAEVVDVTRFYDVDALTTGDEIIEHVTPYVPSDWPSWRCEIRFQKGECKRRAVVRHGESFDVSELNCLRSTRFSPKARLCTAWMTSQRKSTKGKRIDVTERVEKYIMSPSRFLHPLDIFPFDLQEELVECFGSLHVNTVSATGTLQTHEFSFSDPSSDLGALYK